MVTKTDKTGDQLMASIRKSKSGAATRKTPARSSAGKKTTSTSSARRATKPDQAGDTGRFSHGRRVWPD